jgi:hypothetical protein
VIQTDNVRSIRHRRNLSESIILPFPSSDRIVFPTTSTDFASSKAKSDLHDVVSSTTSVRDDEEKGFLLPPISTQSNGLGKMRWYDHVLIAVPFFIVYGLITLATVPLFLNLRVFLVVTTLFMLQNLWAQTRVGWFVFNFLKNWRYAETARNPYKEAQEKRGKLLSENKVVPAQLIDWADVMHYVILIGDDIPTKLVREALTTLSTVEQALKNIFVVIATSGEDADGVSKAYKVADELKDKFAGIMDCSHAVATSSKASFHTVSKIRVV